MTGLADWLSGLEAGSVYPESILDELREYGIGYDGGLLTSHIQTERPYPTYGRIVSAPVLTERELLAKASSLGLGLRFEKHGYERHIFGYDIVASVWRLVRPITLVRPPSEFVTDLGLKARLDIEAIRGYGY